MPLGDQPWLVTRVSALSLLLLLYSPLPVRFIQTPFVPWQFCFIFDSLVSALADARRRPTVLSAKDSTARGKTGFSYWRFSTFRINLLIFTHS